MRKEGVREVNLQGTDTAKPVVLVVEDNPHDPEMIARELDKRYGEDYRIVREGSTEAGLRRLRECEAAGDDVALVLADQWMPRMTGTEFLARVRHVYPGAKRALLVSQGTAPRGAPPAGDGARGD
jgi:thioredoxin reductase (NADPH)